MLGVGFVPRRSTPAPFGQSVVGGQTQMRLGGGKEEEPLVWYGVVSTKIPYVKGRWYVELSICE